MAALFIGVEHAERAPAKNRVSKRKVAVLGRRARRCVTETAVCATPTA